MESIDHSQMLTLAEIPRYHARLRADATAFVFEGRSTSFGEFNRHTSQVANALIGEGVKPGDHVCYVGKNSDHYFEVQFGGAKVGAIMTPVSWRLAGREITYMVNDAKAKLLFVGAECADLIRGIEKDLDTVTRIIAMEPCAAHWPFYAAWRDGASDRDPMLAVGEDDVTLQLYTSGTTGNPKGAMLTHRNLLGGRRIAAHAKMAWNEWGPQDVSLVAMRIAHIGGTGWGLIGLYNGAKGIVAREFDPTKVLDFIEREGISKMFMVPAALQIVVNLPRARQVDYHRLKFILYGASPIPLDLLRECIEVFGCGFVQQYGMTETCGTIVYLPPEDHDPAGNPRMRAAGIPMPGVEIKVVNEAGNPVAEGVVGEVAIRSLSNMAGYWNLPQATSKTIDAEGWLRTGDAGYLDKDGYLYIQDRVKDMIISGGENIYPAEVESAVYGHPDVAEVAVIGIPDAKWGEAVKAVVVAKPGHTIDAADIIRFARERIAAFKAPKSIDVVETLPRNPSGKILRRQLREPYWVGKDRQVN